MICLSSTDRYVCLTNGVILEQLVEITVMMMIMSCAIRLMFFFMFAKVIAFQMKAVERPGGRGRGAGKIG